MRKTAAGLLLGSGAAALVLLLALLEGSTDRLALLERAELQTYDWRMRRSVSTPPSVHPDIVLVEINDTTIRDLANNAGRWPWPRVVMSSLVDYLSRTKAKVIALDLAFLEPDTSAGFKYGADTWSGKESDEALATSVRQASNVVLLADAVYRGALGAEQHTRPAEWQASPYQLGPAIEEVPLIIPPFEGLTKSARALGENLLALDEDGPARRMAPFVRMGDRYMPSLGIAAALIAADIKPQEVTLEGRTIRIRDRSIPLVPVRVQDAYDKTKHHDQLTMLINYRAPALVNGARPYKSYEARHLLYSEEQLLAGQQPMVDPAVFKDKIVFVGLTASGLVDVFQTPFGSTGKMPGIQLHASIADSVLSNRFIRPASSRSRVVATFAGATLIGLMSALLPFIAATAGALLAVSGWTWYALQAFRGGVWLNMAQPLLGITVALFMGTAYQYFVEGREKRIVKKLFGRYVSRDVYQQLIANPELAELGGKRRDMTVLFSDIRGFTTVTERGDPEQLVAQLNEYFSRMVDVVFRHRGTVDKFVGDMVMALFGAPLDDPAHADHAVAAAVTMIDELGALNRKWRAEGRAHLDIGVGINSGDMIAGNIGSSSIMSYTVIGDNVNLGSRLESLNKEYGTRIIISDSTRVRLTGVYDIRPLGDVVVKGKTHPVAIFEIIVPSPLPSATEEATL